MKLGQVYFQIEDFLNAQEQFETLAREQPDGPLTETALFLAGQCGARLINTTALNHALELFSKVVEKKGPLESYARLQQAVLKSKMGSENDSVNIYDSILGGSAPAEVRNAAIVGKGDTLMELGKKDVKQMQAAISSYDQLLALADTGPTWRNQAAYKKGRALAQLDRKDDALAVFYDVLDKTAAGPRETFWFAKAGFDAASLLEAARQWKNAIGVYEKMAKVPGPHAEQAKQRIKTLRLEHFLWD
jgi:tetratricopeptide (TPR) repeat protein